MIKRLINKLGLYTEADIKVQNRLFQGVIDKYQDQINNLNFLLKPYEKHLTLVDFREWLKLNVVPYRKKYSASRSVIFNERPYRIDSEAECHKYLNLTNLEEYIDFTEGLTNRMKIDDPDELVYKLNLKLNDLLYGKYRTDQQVWKTNEYWENSEELYNLLVTEKVGLDCDSVAFFKYHCIKSLMLLKGWWFTNSWRLRVFIVDILGVGKHAMLGWVKEGPNDWLIIESTFHPTEFQRIWDGNMLLHNNYMYRILWSFDDTKEYRRI